MMNVPFQPPNRAHDMSPVSIASEWSGVNNYNHPGRSDSPYNMFNNDSITPPDSASAANPPPYSRQNGFNPPPMDSMDRRRPSESGSRHSSRAASVANSRSSDGTISDQQSKKYRRMEMELHQHYTVLRAYLKGSAQQPPRPNKARDKLLRLSPVQFHELSTDVFDELQRRQASAPLPGRPPRSNNVPPFLQPRPNFHEKRNQARQKLSSLQTSRFRDLSTDVFCELERRFPHFARGDGRPQSRGGARGPGPNAPNVPPPPRNNSNGLPGGPRPGHPRGQGSMGSQYDAGPNGDFRPMPRQFQSNTITPNKSTMVEDEDEMHGVDSKFDRSSDAFGLESALTSPRSDRDTSATSQSTGSGGPLGKSNNIQTTELQHEIAELRETLQAKEEELKEARDNAGDPELIQDLERKLADAEELNKSMKEELEEIQAEHANSERDLRGELEAAKNAALLGRSDEAVKQENDRLHQRLKQQQTLIEEVRRQGRQHLEEMRAMAESGGGNSDREDKLYTDVQRLETELTSWKTKYAKAKAQLRTMRASSLGLDVSQLSVGGRARVADLYSETGAVKDFHITKFQIAVDELLKIARESEPTAVLDHMKTVVLAVRNITTDIEHNAATTKDEEVLKKRSKLKSKVSATANNLITASKNYAAAGGLSPVSLLDAAASHLTAAVVDLIKMVKIRPSPPGELEAEDDEDGETLEPLQGNGYFNIAENLRRRSAVDSIYSALSSPNEGNDESGPGPEIDEDTDYGNSNGHSVHPQYGLGQEDADLEDLKVYLEDQTQHLVESIQFLIEAIRGEEPLATIRDNIDRIVTTVESVVMGASRGATEPSAYQIQWREETSSIQHNLEQCREKLLQARDDSKTYDTLPSAKDFTQKLPPLAFQIARETRELVRRIQGIKAGGGGDDDFS